MSSLSAVACAADAAEPVEEVCAVVMPLISDNAKIRTAICAISFRSRRFMMPPCSRSQFSDMRFGIRYAHGLRPAARRGPPIFSSLGVNTALANGVRHTINRKHVSCDAIVNVMSFGVTDDVVE